MKRIGCQLALLALVLCNDASAEPSLGARMQTVFAPAAKAILDNRDTPGMAIAVVHDGAIAYKAAFGVKSVDTNEPLATDSLFHWASVTKPFVATAIMQLVEDNKVDLDEKVTAYLPYFEMADDRYKAITVRQLLTHTSGMPDVRDYEWDNPVYDDEALERYVRSLADKRLIADPGTKVQYSNIAFEVLGDVIAKASGQTFEAYVQEHILTPLRMDDSTLLKQEANEALLTTPHTHSFVRGTITRKHWPYNRMHAPSSTMISNVEDMARWAIANLNRGELDGARILDAASYDILWSPQSGIGEGEGLSWFLNEYQGHRRVMHSGGDKGFASNFILYPDDGLGLMLVFNTDDAPRSEITDLAQDIILGTLAGSASAP